MKLTLRAKTRAGSFPTTRWDLIRRVCGRSSDTQQSKALNELCERYWRPVFGFIRQRGAAPAEAEDLAQEFLILVIRRKLVERASPDLGRFRCLLLKSLQNFLVDEHLKANRQKRGGRLEFVPFDEFETIGGLSPEEIFDVRWAATLTESAIRQLRQECEAHGEAHLYEVFSQYLGAERADINYRIISAEVRLSEHSVKRLLHTFRKRFRTLLRDEVAKTVGRRCDVDEEIHHLCRVLAQLPKPLPIASQYGESCRPAA